MSAWHTLAAIESRELLPGFSGRFIHSDAMTFVYWDIEAGSLLPEHAHPHEQVAHMLEGRFELTIAGQKYLLSPGDVVVIPPHAVHSGNALTKTRILDVFYPIRDDYRFDAKTT